MRPMTRFVDFDGRISADASGWPERKPAAAQVNLCASIRWEMIIYGCTVILSDDLTAPATKFGWFEGGSQHIYWTLRSAVVKDGRRTERTEGRRRADLSAQHFDISLSSPLVSHK